jgi:hypothetical protein
VSFLVRVNNENVPGFVGSKMKENKKDNDLNHPTFSSCKNLVDNKNRVQTVLERNIQGIYFDKAESHSKVNIPQCFPGWSSPPREPQDSDNLRRMAGKTPLNSQRSCNSRGIQKIINFTYFHYPSSFLADRRSCRNLLSW